MRTAVGAVGGAEGIVPKPEAGAAGQTRLSDLLSLLLSPEGLTATNLQGLTPDQVAQVARTGLESETLRQQAVGKILGFPGEQAQTELARAQAFRLRNPIVTAKTPEEINKIKQQAFQAEQAGLLSEQRRVEIDRLLDAKEQAVKLGNEDLQKQIDERLTVLFPNVEGGTDEAQVRARDVIAAMSRSAAGGTPSTLPERKFTTQQEQTAVEIEQVIRKKPKGKEALARYEDFNRYSNRTKIAVSDGKKVKWVPLGTIDGRTVTSKEVYDAAAGLGMTVDQLYNRAQDAGMDILQYLQALLQSTQ